MILRGDGKANLHQSSCFEPALKKSIIEPDKTRGVKRPNIGLLNPPYAQSKSDAELHELYFVKEIFLLVSLCGLCASKTTIQVTVPTG
jgi:hypothetical protein